MARPKKKESEKKSERFAIQLTPNEVELLGGRSYIYDILQIHLNKLLKDK